MRDVNKISKYIDEPYYNPLPIFQNWGADREDTESLLHLLLRIIGKAANLREFDWGEIVMVRKLGTSISEIA